MNGSRSTPHRLGERSSLDALSRTIEGLEARIEGLVGQSSREQRQHYQEPLRAPDRGSEREPRDLRPDPLAEIRERQRMLEESRNRALSGAGRGLRANDDLARREPVPPQPDAYRMREQRVPAPQPATPAAAQPAHEAALKDIAQALVSLREELKRDIHDGIARQVTALRGEMHDIKAVAGEQRGTDDLRAELARLGESIDLLGHQTRARNGSPDLKAEFEDLRALMDGLAREDSMRHMENRWTGVERRIDDINPAPLREDVLSLAYRLEDIKTQLGTLNPSPALHALEDRLVAVAQAMEQLGRHIRPNDQMIGEQFAGLDLRLDEISRAVAASARAGQAQEPEHFNRLERRLSGLADQIGMISEENSRRPDPAAALAARIETLADRVGQLVANDSGVEAAARLEERLDQLSRLLERSQKAPPAPELTGFLSDISRKIDALDNGPVNDQLTERLEYLARRIDEIEYPVASAPQDEGALLRMETRLSDIARRLDETAVAPASDTRALQSLENQIANLAQLISQPQPAAASALPAEFEHRMASIEDYMATSDEYIIEAARQAAEAVMEAYGRNGAPASVDLSAITALAGDLRHLEELAHSSEARTHRTFEALHDTLVQIAGRLDDMDSRLREPQPMQQAYAPAFSAPASMAMADSISEDHYFREERPVARPAPPEQADVDRIFERSPMGAIRAAAADMHAAAANPVIDRNVSGPVIRTVEPDIAEAVEQAARVIASNAGKAPAPKVKSGFLSSLTGKLRGKGKATPARATAPDRAVVDPTPPMMPEDETLHSSDTELLEPGSGAPDIKKILERVRANQGKTGSAADSERSDLIAAARRAAQAAAQEVSPAAQKLARGKETKGSARVAGTEAKGSSVFNRHRRPILMAVGAILLALATLPAITFLRGAHAPAPENASADIVQPADSASAQANSDDSGDTTLSAVRPKPVAQKPVASVTARPVASPVPPAAKPVAAAVNAKDASRLTGEAPVASAAPLVASAATSQPAASPLVTPQPSPAIAAAPAVAGITVPATLEPKALADAARSGDSLALFEIGARYTEGRGVKADLAEAARWYQQSADKGFAPAQYRIANLYEKGNGVARDMARARDYYERAAKAGNASAMHNLAVIYASGIDGKPDNASAVTWFRQAADFGVSDSQFNLAILYARGSGTPQDLAESYKWFAIAAKGGDKDAASKRDDVANAMKPDQLQDARAKVDLWKPKPLDAKANATEVPDAWVGKGVKTASVDMKKAIRNIQAILNNNGFDAGKPDGNMGAKTISAIKAFQKSAGLPEDGKITDRLVKELLARNK